MLLPTTGVSRDAANSSVQSSSVQSTSVSDRRGSDRFPMERDVRYKVLSKRQTEESGVGKTIDMSSSGVLFTTDHQLAPGKRVEVSISWPAHLNQSTALKFVARGRVARVLDGKAALEIQQYEFRTAGKVRPV